MRRVWGHQGLAEAAFGELSEKFAHRMPLAVEMEVEFADTGPARKNRVHLGIGSRPLQPGLADQELPRRSFQRAPFLICYGSCRS
jgi:hypothetical protein